MSRARGLGASVPLWVRLMLAFYLLVALLLIQYFRPLPALAVSSDLPAESGIRTQPPTLPWPAGAQSAIGLSGYGLVATTDRGKPQPMASVAKIMTALQVLSDHPLGASDEGPSITVDTADVSDFQAKQSAGESVVTVAAGEKLTERQALEGLLLPSGNNIADLLGKWDAGSPAAMVQKLNQRAKAMRLAHTHFADNSGFSELTVSTPSDLVHLGLAAMDDAALAAIVAEPNAVLPVAGRVYSVDYVLGEDGIAGIKTGSSPPAGACFVFAVNELVDGTPVRIVGAVMGLPTLDAAFSASKSLIDAARPSVQVIHPVAKDRPVGSLQARWGQHTDLLPARSVTLVAWPGSHLVRRIEAAPVQAPLRPSSSAGSLYVRLGEQVEKVPLATGDALSSPSDRWRLSRTDPL